MGKLGACVIKKVVSVTFIFTNSVKFHNCLFPCVCVFYSFTPMLFLFLVFPSKDFVFSYLIMWKTKVLQICFSS